MRALFLLFLLLVSVTATLGDYEYFAHASQWIPSFCATKPCYAQYVSQARFTIHGLWPQAGLKDKSNTPFDISKITDKTMEYMKVNWPSLQKRNPNNKFWEHEWDEHGKWSANNFDIEAYFDKGLEVFSRVGPINLLKNAGIQPDQTKKYKAVDVKNAIKKHTGHDPDLDCNKKDQLLEIRICLDAQANEFQDCKYHTGQCPDEFLFPPA